MTHTPHATTRRPLAASLRHFTVIALTVVLAMHLSSTASLAEEHPVGLGTADSFAVLAGETITNSGPTTITGDVGLHPGTAVTGDDEWTLDGSLHETDAVAEEAKVDLVTAYNDAAGRAVTETIVPALDGQELGPGVYESTAAGAFLLGVDGTLTLTGGPDDVWIFQSGSTLDFQSGSQVVLDGADPCNVFWQVTSSATLGTNSSVVGTIMALEAITLETEATIEGQVLARDAAVTLDTNTITNAACTTPTEDNGNGNGNGDDTAEENGNGNGNDTAEDDTTADDDTTGQIEEVPRGSVAAGGGPGATADNGLWLLFAGVLLVLVVSGTVGTIARRRSRA